jgi:hypothetical protein
MKVFGVSAVFFEELAEVEDKVVDGARGRVYVVAPYDLQYLLPRYYFTFMFYQQLQQGGFFLAQLLLMGLILESVDSLSYFI